MLEKVSHICFIGKQSSSYCHTSVVGLSRSAVLWSQNDEHCNLIQIKTVDSFFFSFHFPLVASNHCFSMKITAVAHSGSDYKVGAAFGAFGYTV